MTDEEVQVWRDNFHTHTWEPTDKFGGQGFLICNVCGVPYQKSDNAKKDNISLSCDQIMMKKALR